MDDASDPPLRLDLPNVKVLRIDVDVPWNQPAASNMGIKSLHAGDVVLRLDIDHWVDPGDFHLFESLSRTLQPRTILQFGRVASGTGRRLRPNMNMMMLRVSDFLAIGCYDEDFCGSYGYDDREFVDRARRLGWRFDVPRSPSLVVDPRGGTRSLSRDASVNREKYLMKSGKVRHRPI